MPVIVSQIDNDGYKHGEGLLLVCLQDVQEVVILKETHSSVSNLQMNAANAPYYSLEQLWNQMLNFVNFTNLQNFLELSQEKGFLNTISEWPVLEQAFQKWNGKSSIFSEEQHRASQQLFVKLRASLNFMERDYNIFKEDHMFISQGDCESTNNTSQNIKELGSTVKFMSFMDQ